MEASSLIAFLLYAFGLMGPIMELTRNVTALQSGFGRRLRGLRRRPDPRAAWSHRCLGPPDTDPAVAEVDLVIPRRGHVAVAGPVGRGQRR